MATLTVTNLNDSGAGSLRAALAAANAAGGDTIVFQAGLTGTINIQSVLTIDRELTLTGPGADKVTISGAAAADQDSIFSVSATAAISGLTLRDGVSAQGNGGGAIHSIFANLTLDGMNIVGNSAPGGEGGGVAVVSASVFITNSTFSGNSAALTGAVTAGNATLRNVTLTANTAADWGTITVSAGTLSTLTNVTIVGNAGGGFYTSTASGLNLSLSNSVVANNGAADFGAAAAGGVWVTSGDYNLIGNTVGSQGLAAAPHLITGVAPQLGALANNGGPVPTMLPLAGSPLINAGDPAYAGPATDERGYTRVSGGRIDIGAVEFGAAAPAGPAPVAAAPPAAPTTPAPPPTVAPQVNGYLNTVLGYYNSTVFPQPATVTTPTGQVLPNPVLEQQKAIQALIAKVDAGILTLKQAQDIIVDMADGTTAVAALSYQFFTGRTPTKDGLAFLVSSPLNPNDLNDGAYAGMSVENRYINFAVNLGKSGEGRANFEAQYGGALSITDAAARAYQTIFGTAPDAAKLGAILTPERLAYFNALGGDPLGAKAAMVGFLLSQAALTDTGPLAANNEAFLYDMLDGTAAYGASLDLYGPLKVGLVGVAEGFS